MTNKIILDTFFLSPKQALKISKQQNTITVSNKIPKNSIFSMDIATQKRQEFYKDLQICYYSGEELKKESIPKNCIYVPIDKLFDFFKSSRLRYPQLINFKGIELDKKSKREIILIFRQALNNAILYKRDLVKKYTDIIKNNKPNFTEPLRIFATGNRHTTALQNVLRNSMNAFKGCDYETLYSIEDNSMESLELCWHLKSFAEFNPHITLSINSFNHEYLNDYIYNIVWFQDYVPVIVDEEIPIELRKRDIVFSLFKDIDILLEKKDIPFYRQSFCAEESIFYKDEKIVRENKIVFIGHRSHEWQKEFPDKLIQEVKVYCEEAKYFSKEAANLLGKKYSTSPFYIYALVYPGIMRELSVKWMCKVSPIPVEVYGDDVWKEDPDVKKCFIKKLSYGEEIRKAYNSAKYVLVAQPKYLRNQRLYEGVASGCTPVVYDCRPYENPPHHEDEILYFKSKSDLRKILKKQKEPKDNPMKLLNGNRYKDLAHKIIFMVQQKNKGRN